MTPPQWIFLYTLYGQVSEKSSEVAIELSILVSWIATTCGWWKSGKDSNSSFVLFFFFVFFFFFLPLMLLIFMLMNFDPLIKLLLFVTQGDDLSLFSFVRGTNLFSVSKFIYSPKNKPERLKNSHFGQIHVQFVSFTVSYWVSATNEHSLWIHISQPSHWTALWPFRTTPLQRPQSIYSLYNTHSSHSRSLSDALQYFLHKPHWNLRPAFISISPARMVRINKFVPFEGLKLRSPSELLRFPSFLILAKHWDTLLWELVWTKRIFSIHPFPKNESKNQKQNRFVEQLTSDLRASMPTVDNSALTKPEAMIHNEQAGNNYPDPESFTENWQFQRASQQTAPKFI